ncbi:MAG: hypothetical protein ACOCUW_01210 [Gemmatimonadota bacterium]
MGEAQVITCPHCGRGRPARFRTDGRGGLVDETPPCGCPEDRRKRGICRDCDQPVYGAKGKALRCPRHHREAKRRQWRRYYEKNREKRNARASERWHNDPEYRTRKRLARRRRKRENPEKYRRQRREQRKRRALRNPDAILEERRRTEARPERIQARRDWAHENQTVYAGTDRVPRCEDCGEEVPWSGRGRPMQKCERCDPKRWEQARRRRAKRKENGR